MSYESLQSISGGIIGSGIKYIMFPLHLLHFCLFGTNSVSKKLTGPKEQKPKNSTADSKEENEEKTRDKEDRSAKDDGTSDRRPSKEDRRQSESGSCSETKEREPDEKDSKAKRRNDDEGITNAVVGTEDDSDCSTDRWSSASSSIITNMPVDYDNINKCISFPVLEEPMGISMEEYMHEKPLAVAQEPRDNYTTENMFIRAPWFYIEEQDSNSSVDEEVAKIFEKQCTSKKSFRNNEPKHLCHKKGNTFINASESKKPEEVDKERKKKAPSDVIHTKRKSSQDYDKNEKHRERKNETKPREEKHSFRQDSSSKFKTKFSKNPVKDKDIKYKDMATQTDSAFSDDDVEIDMKLIEKQFHCKCAAYRLHSNPYQDREMGHELNYIGDNEEPTERLTRNARQRISSCSTSSSSTDLGFDEYMFASSDAEIFTGRWNGNTGNPFRICNRPPPGFPDLPQNPPLSYTPGDWKKFELTSLVNNNCNASVPTSGMVPRAPSPMRHLYYDYPEFMDLPPIIKSSKILDNIAGNYYR